MGFFSEFKQFAVKGNVVDMGVGIVLGAAFTSIVNSFVVDILNPFVGVFTGGIDFSDWFITIGGETYESLAAAQEAGAPTINYGLFISAMISFAIVAMVLFVLIRQVNRLKTAFEEEEATAPATPPAPPEDVRLLTEIRDLLAERRP